LWATGIPARSAIEEAVRDALAAGKLKGGEKLAAEARVSLGGRSVDPLVGSEIELE
jgi:hypothetical protein